MTNPFTYPMHPPTRQVLRPLPKGRLDEYGIMTRYGYMVYRTPITLVGQIRCWAGKHDDIETWWQPEHNTTVGGLICLRCGRHLETEPRVFDAL